MEPEGDQVRFAGPFRLEDDGDFVWVMDAYEFAIARIQVKGFEGIAEFTEAEMREAAQFIVDAMNSIDGGPW